MLKWAYNEEHHDFDMVLGDHGLEEDDTLTTLVVLSEYTDARARPGDELPDPDGDPRGHWGDTYPEVEDDVTGSLLWLHERSVATQQDDELMKKRAAEALDWMVEDGLAKEVRVELERQGDIRALRIQVVKPDGDVFRWAHRWRAS